MRDACLPLDAFVSSRAGQDHRFCLSLLSTETEPRGSTALHCSTTAKRNATRTHPSSADAPEESALIATLMDGGWEQSYSSATVNLSSEPCVLLLRSVPNRSPVTTSASGD